MARYFVTRMLQAGITLWLVTVLVFVLVRLSGDPIQLLVSPEATTAEIELVRQNYGLDGPWLDQYVTFLTGALQGDFGSSIRFKEPAMELVLERLPATIKLAAAGMALTIGFGLTVGVISGLRPSGFVDRVGSMIALLGQAVPAFWLAIMLILVFSVQLGWFPTSGYGGFMHMILPAIALSHFSTAALMRLSRSAILDVTGSDYVRLAHLKGVHPFRVATRHVLRNAAIPIVTLASVQLIGMLNGAIVTETIFAWPGVGRLMIDSVNARDFPVIQAGVFVTAVMFIAGNLIVDFTYALLDPRIRY